MAMIAGHSFSWVEFDKSGALAKPLPGIPADATDVVILCHGWKTDRPGARSLYAPLVQNISPGLQGAKAANGNPRVYAFLGVLWPSRKYDANYAGTLALDSRTASANRPGALADLAPDQLDALVESYAEFMGIPDAGTLKELAAGAASRMEHGTCSQLMAAVTDPIEDSQLDRELHRDLEPYAPAGALRTLQSLMPPPIIQGMDGTTTLSADSKRGSLLSGARAAIGRLLNQLTFFEMKKRAGRVGQGLAREVLPVLAQVPSRRMHLVGHSFGARLATSAVFHNDTGVDATSLALLQGAFSHNALSDQKKGAYAFAYKKLSGSAVITHTHNDKAVTHAYAIASRLSRDSTKALGDKDDAFGAIGANGAIFLPATDAGDFTPGALDHATIRSRKVCNVVSDSIISDHMDVTNAEVASIVAKNLTA